MRVGDVEVDGLKQSQMFLEGVDLLDVGVREGNAGPVGMVKLCESVGKLLLNVTGVMFGYYFFDGFKDRLTIELLRVAEVNRKEDFLDKSKTLLLVKLSGLVEQSSEAEMKNIANCIIIFFLNLQFLIIF